MAKWYLPVKRLADILAAGAMLIILAPLFMLIAIVLKLSDRGAVFFSQKRSGLGGREFTIYKFRTMRPDRKHDPFEYVPAGHSDITAVGRSRLCRMGGSHAELHRPLWCGQCRKDAWRQAQRSCA